MSLVWAQVAAFDGDPASLARDNILEIVLPISGQMSGCTRVVVTGVGGPGLRHISYEYNLTIFADSASSNVFIRGG